MILYAIKLKATHHHSASNSKSNHKNSQQTKNPKTTHKNMTKTTLNPDLKIPNQNQKHHKN
jgi:hypothetical protein